MIMISAMISVNSIANWCQ